MQMKVMGQVADIPSRQYWQ